MKKTIKNSGIEQPNLSPSKLQTSLVPSRIQNSSDYQLGSTAMPQVLAELASSNSIISHPNGAALSCFPKAQLIFLNGKQLLPFRPFQHLPLVFSLCAFPATSVIEFSLPSAAPITIALWATTTLNRRFQPHLDWRPMSQLWSDFNPTCAAIPTRILPLRREQALVVATSERERENWVEPPSNSLADPKLRISLGSTGPPPFNATTTYPNSKIYTPTS